MSSGSSPALWVPLDAVNPGSSSIPMPKKWCPQGRINEAPSVARTPLAVADTQNLKPPAGLSSIPTTCLGMVGG